MSFIDNSSTSNIQEGSSLTIPETSSAHLFVESRSDINTANEFGWTPLYRSLLSNNLSAAKDLLKMGANPNITNNMSETPLYQAVDMGNMEAVQLLIDYSANTNISKSDGNTPLHIAVRKQRRDLIKILLENGADPNSQNKLYQQTPLHVAMKSKSDIETIKLLHKFKANPNIRDKYDKTPIDYCEDQNYKDQMKTVFGDSEMIYIEDHSSDISIQKSTPKRKDVINKTGSFTDDIAKEKFTSGEVVKGGSDFATTTPIPLVTETNNAPSVIESTIYLSKTEYENKKLENVINITGLTLNANTTNNLNSKFLNVETQKTPEEVSKSLRHRGPHTSTFNLSTPKENKTIYNSMKENSTFNLDANRETVNPQTRQSGVTNGTRNKSQTTMTISNHNSGANNSLVNRDMISDINPLDLITQVVTTNNSNIFSELQVTTQEMQSAKSEKSKAEDSDEEGAESNNNVDIDIKDNTNEMNDSLDDHDMTYSKSKSYIVSELPMTSVKKSSSLIGENNTPLIERFNESEKEIEFSGHKVNHFSALQKPNVINKISYHRTQKDHNKENVNTLNKAPGEKRSESMYQPKNVGYLNSSFNNNNITDNEVNLNTSNIKKHNISLNSTRQTTAQYNTYSNRLLNTSGMGAGTTKKIPVGYETSTIVANSKAKKNSILTEYAFKSGQWIPQIYYDETPNDVGSTYNNEFRTHITASEAKRLHEWLLSCDLLCYYNTLVDQGIYKLDKCIEGLRNGEVNLTFKEVEEFGIKKPGHAFRFLLKMESDAELIDKRLVEYVCPNKLVGEGLLRNSNVKVILGRSEEYCGCAFRETRTIREMDLETWLRIKGLLYLKENFLHNGFESIEYVLLQMFSKYAINDPIMIDCLHIYNASDRKKVKKVLEEEKKAICVKLGIPYNKSNEEESSILTETIEHCQMCTVF